MKAKQTSPSSLSIEMLERVSTMLRLLAHPHRLKVIEYLEDKKDGAPVMDVQSHVDLPHAATSQHLNQMKRVGLLKSERRGKEVWYAINDPRALTILGCIRKQQDKS
jgi:ArsR family transcriptional regulator